MRQRQRQGMMLVLLACLGMVSACATNSEEGSDLPGGSIRVKPSASTNSVQSESSTFASATWRLEFEKPATSEDTLRILGSQNDAVVEVFFQLPYGEMHGGGSVKRGNVQNTLEQATSNYRKMLGQMVYPTDEQLKENTKDSTLLASHLARVHQIKADDTANLRYLETHTVPVSAVRFNVLPEQQEAFSARWSQPESSSLTHFKVRHMSSINQVDNRSLVNFNPTSN